MSAFGRKNGSAGVSPEAPGLMARETSQQDRSSPTAQFADVDTFGRYGSRAEKAIYLAIAVKVAIIFLFAWHILIVMDEFVQLGFAKHLGTRIFDTIQPTKALGFAVFYKLSHLIGWNAVSIVLAARLQTAVLACGTLFLVYACARALGEERVRALTIVLVLLSFSNFMERSFRTISEPPALFFAVAALLVILRGQAHKPRDILIAGVLSGMAFLTTQKSVYFNVALGLGLTADAALAGRYFDGVRRIVWLMLGWFVPIVVYCFAFGVSPLVVAHSVVLGPMEVATQMGGAYDYLRNFVLQFLFRNLGLVAFCLVGMILSLRQIRQLPQNRRVALVFSLVVTALVFVHDQPWPYVFIMALPFMALWALVPLDRLARRNARYLRLGWIALVVLMATSLASNVRYFRFDNERQLQLVARAEAMLSRDETYFDAIAMLPNRQEPTALWLDRFNVLKTLHEGTGSEAYEVFRRTPPKLVIWSYRLKAIEPVVGSTIRDSYVRVAPNIWLAGQKLSLEEPVTFDVPIEGTYRLYDERGRPVAGRVDFGGTTWDSHVDLVRGQQELVLQSGPAEALLVPDGHYAGIFAPGGDDPKLFEGVYD